LSRKTTNKWKLGTLGYFFTEFKKFLKPSRPEPLDTNMNLPLVIINDDTKEEYRICGWGIQYENSIDRFGNTYILPTGKKLNFCISITRRDIDEFRAS